MSIPHTKYVKALALPMIVLLAAGLLVLLPGGGQPAVGWAIAGNMPIKVLGTNSIGWPDL